MQIFCLFYGQFTYHSLLLMIGSCLEEGAEEFLLKPVKLSDVKRVTDFVMRGEGKRGGKRYQKRRRSDDCNPSLSTEISPLSPSTLSSKKSRLWVVLLMSPFLLNNCSYPKASDAICIFTLDCWQWVLGLGMRKRMFLFFLTGYNFFLADFTAVQMKFIKN